MTLDLFDERTLEGCRDEQLSAGAVVLRGFALGRDIAIIDAVNAIAAPEHAPFRHMVTPSGHTMSVAMTNCGPLGWVSDRAGYRYAAIDPLTDRAWPPMPEVFERLAVTAAQRAGFEGFEPDACLVNRYEPGARLTLHQDRNETDFGAPIVSVSLGLPALFLFGGDTRRERPLRVPLRHGDVVVWGGPARLRYHGVLPLADGEHPLVGRARINLTFRKAA